MPSDFPEEPPPCSRECDELGNAVDGRAADAGDNDVSSGVSGNADSVIARIATDRQI